MATKRLQTLAWQLAKRQHGVVSRAQLLKLGFSTSAIRHRVAKGRLHRVYRGVYAVGRPELTREGRLMAAVLRCRPGAALSHLAAGAGWRILSERHIRWILRSPIDISLGAAVVRTPPGIRVHRTTTLTESDITVHNGIPITTPIRTLIDLATELSSKQLEAAVNEADVLDLVDPETLRAALEDRKGEPGVRPLRTLLDRHTFRLTDSELERRFLRVVKRAGLPLPETQTMIEGRTDFYWPSLGLIVETDGWRYHRTPSRQASDNLRMQAHAAAGRTAIRFSHYEIRHSTGRVVEVLTTVASQLASRR